MPVLRPDRLLAVVRRELARASAGRRGWGLLLFSLALLLPAGSLRLPGQSLPGQSAPGQSAPGRSAAPSAGGLAVVQVVDDGGLPPAFLERVQLKEDAKASVQAGPPPRVKARVLGPSLRAALTAVEPTPAVRLVLSPRTLRLPGRALLVALLAISMLTGPLAETLPGEREAKTLEVLLSTSLSRLELVTGKWLTWTLASSAVALLAGLGGVLSGTLHAGAWVLAMPAALGLAVALGLWLVRSAGDLVGGAALPMRVLPLVAVGGTGLALALAQLDPLLGALVPLGGALLAASDLLTGPTQIGLALVSSLLGSALLVWVTATSLDRQGIRVARAGSGAVGITVLAAGAWWLAVAGPGVFALGGATERLASAATAVSAGGLLLGIVAAVALARTATWPRLLSQGRRPLLSSLGAGLLGGVLIVGAMAGPGAGPGAGLGDLLAVPWAAPLHERLGAAGQPLGLGVMAMLRSPLALVPATLAVFGQELIFRVTLQRRMGVLATALAWALIVQPTDPVRGLLVGIALGLLATRWGLLAAVVAHLCWVLG